MCDHDGQKTVASNRKEQLERGRKENFADRGPIVRGQKENSDWSCKIMSGSESNCKIIVQNLEQRPGRSKRI